MAGSWEPLLFRVRRDGSDGYTPTAEQQAAYQREHSPEMIARLKALGVNFVMGHCYKAFGMNAEQESMADAVRFARLCRDTGLRVGVYVSSGTIGWELFYKEVPEAKDWVVRDAKGNPVTYGRANYRYYWDRNHPDAQAYANRLTRFAIEEIRADLLHWDNYHVGPGTESNSQGRFGRWRRAHPFGGPFRRFDPTADAGVPQVALLKQAEEQAWKDFCCRSLAESYHDLGRYARSLRRDILLECNPGGPGDRIRLPIDHGRLLTGGEAFWDEGEHPGFRNGRLITRIRTYKIARRMDNIAFTYTTTPVEAAEAMAFNLDCLGCIVWFEYDKLVAKPGATAPVSKALHPFVQFFHARRDLLRDARVVADAAVLCSFPSQVFADPKHAALTAHVEQMLIENRVPFQIIYDRHLDDLERYRALVLAGAVAMSDAQITQVKRYVASGGRVCLVGPAATHDEWMQPRREARFDDLPAGGVVRALGLDDALDAVRRACGGRFSLAADAGRGLCAELTEQTGRRLVHLVNYRPDHPAENIPVTLAVPAGHVVQRVTVASPAQATDMELPYRQETGEITFHVPCVDVYAVVSAIWR